MALTRGRHPYPVKRHRYRYRAQCHHHPSYVVCEAELSTDRPESYNWNFLDNYVCTKGESPPGANLSGVHKHALRAGFAVHRHFINIMREGEAFWCSVLPLQGPLCQCAGFCDRFTSLARFRSGQYPAPGVLSDRLTRLAGSADFQLDPQLRYWRCCFLLVPASREAGPPPDPKTLVDNFIKFISAVTFALNRFKRHQPAAPRPQIRVRSTRNPPPVSSFTDLGRKK